MKALFVLKVYCIPPDINKTYPGAVEDLLSALEQDVKDHIPRIYYDIPIGISLVADVSDYRIGDVIWAEGEFRGNSEVRAIAWGVLNCLAETLMRDLHGFVVSWVNHPGRLAEAELDRVPCNHISVTVGSENGPVTATCQRLVD